MPSIAKIALLRKGSGKSVVREISLAIHARDICVANLNAELRLAMPDYDISLANIGIPLYYLADMMIFN